jgi:hypothetical protein
MPSATLETLEAANLADAERWHTLVSSSPAPDVYYLPEYALATAELERAEPVAIVAGADPCRFLAPLLVRRMSSVVNGDTMQWIDACTPYGYGGLLPLSISQAGDAPGLGCFFDDLHDWCSVREIVCCVLRLHPLMRQDEWFAAEEQWQTLLRVQSRGSTTAIRLENWDHDRDRPSGMHKDKRWDLNVSRRTLSATWTTGEDRDVKSSIDRFSALYAQTMERHHADTFYRFPPSYFSRLTSLGRQCGIVFAWLNDELAGASIFLAGRDYAHYHLAAANEIGLKHRAPTLLVVEGAKWARQQGCKLLHLGGGLSPGDSLEDFKLSFGGQSCHYAYLVYVADQERFEQLCQMPNAPWPYRMNDR